MNKLFLVPLVLAGIAVGAAFSLFAFGGESATAALPSSKAAVAMSSLVDLEAAAESADEAGLDSDTTGWVNLLTTNIHVNSGGDLTMDFAAQCALLTDTTVKSVNGTEDISEAQAGIRFRIKIFNLNNDGTVGAFNQFALPYEEDNPFTAAIEANAGVTYCDRYQLLRAKFAGLDCTADLITGAITCATPEELQLILRTLDAHSFNFLALDLSSGRYHIVVQGKADATALDHAGARAIAGLGSLVVEKIRLVRGATVEIE